MKHVFILFLFYSSISFAELDYSKVLLATGQKNIHTDILIIQHDGKNIFEIYQNEYDKTKVHLSWSMAKTISGFLIAIASNEYHFSLDEKVKKYIPDFKGDARIIDVLQMSSGIDFSEEYSGLPVNADVVRMLYLDGLDLGSAGYVTTLPLRNNNQPGDHFYYSSGDTNLLMELLKKIINNDEVYLNYPWIRLFNPLGITTATIELDSKNIFIGSSYMYMTADDYLKIGQLILNHGKMNQQQIVPSTYMDLITQVAPGVQKKAIAGASPFRAYSVMATTNQPITEKKLNSEFEYIPADSILLLGHQGQILLASEKEKLIVLRLAMDKGSALVKKEFYKNIYDFLVSKNEKIEIAKNIKTFSVENQNNIKPDEVPNKLKFTDLLTIPKLIKNYTAKEYCSCRFVVGRSTEACHADVARSMPVMPRITEGVDFIETNFFFDESSKAIFKGSKFGCALLSHAALN